MMGSRTDAALRRGVTYGRNGKGSIYVFANGNGGPEENANDDGYANHPFTISVAATHETTAAYFSEWSSCISLAAPGYQVLAGDNYEGFRYFYGSSAAAPFVTGVVALMLEVNSNLSYRDVHEILLLSSFLDESTPHIYNSAGKRYNYFLGSGFVDARRATQLSKKWILLSPPEEITQTSTEILPMPAVLAFSFDENKRVEQVQICVKLEGTARGMQIWLKSPAGTKAILASPSSRVSTIAGCSYASHCFTSMITWGETLQGTWTIFFVQPSHADGAVLEVTMTAHVSSFPMNVHGCIN
jgi:hypothetical protein